LSSGAAYGAFDVDVPSDFDDAFYQTAPADQQVSELRGGETIVLVNMHPEVRTLCTTLPRLHPLAMAVTADGGRIVFPLRIDTVHIQPDRLRAEIVYRGVTVLADPQLHRLRLAGGIHDDSGSFDLPVAAAATRLVPDPSARGGPLDLSRTVVLPLDEASLLQPKTVVMPPDFEPTSLPFHKLARSEPRPPKSEPAAVATTPFHEEQPVSVRPAATSLASTLEIEVVADTAAPDAVVAERAALPASALLEIEPAPAPPAAVPKPAVRANVANSLYKQFKK
jgi:hypothetical protein